MGYTDRVQRLVPPAGGYAIGGPEYVGLEPFRPPALFLADAIDPETGEFRSILSGVDPVEAWLIEQLRIRRGSGSAVRDVGNRLHEIRFVTPSTPYQIELELKSCWALALDSRWIELKSVDIIEDEDTENIVIVFDNLVSGRDGQRITLPMLALSRRDA
jgi:hypothetical protein